MCKKFDRPPGGPVESDICRVYNEELVEKLSRSVARPRAPAQGSRRPRGDAVGVWANPSAPGSLPPQNASDAESVGHVDGLSISMGDWRFNLRMSNTEPVVRLNVESRGDTALMQAKTAELLALIDS